VKTIQINRANGSNGQGSGKVRVVDSEAGQE
jgi:hypothetical protein